MFQKRLVIYTKDIRRITGKSERYARKLLSDIRKAYNLEDHHLVTASDLSNYTGIPLAHILQYLD